MPPSPSHGVRIADTGRTNDQNRSNVPHRNVLPNRLELRHIPIRPPALNAAIDDLLYDLDFEILGTNASTGDVTQDPEGGWKAETDGADNDQIIILPHLDATGAWAVTTWGTDKETEWTALIKSGSSVADTTLFAGLKLTNTSVVTTNANQVFFRVTAAGNWQLHYAIADVDYTVDTGVTVAADTKYHFEIKIDAGRKASCYINGAFVCETPALVDAIDLIPYVGIHANIAAAKHFYYLGQTISRIFG